MTRYADICRPAVFAESDAHRVRALRWRSPIVIALVMLAGPGLAQDPAPAPLPPPPPLSSSLPAPQRIAALEANVATLIEQVKGASDRANFAAASAANARDQIDILIEQVRQLTTTQVALQSRLGQLGDGYATHTHAISVWGTGCASVPGQPRGQLSCLYVIDDGTPTPRVTSQPTQLAPK